MPIRPDLAPANCHTGNTPLAPNFPVAQQVSQLLNYFQPPHMKYYIKFMVSNRCKMMVQDELKKLGLHYFSLELGVVDIKEDITPEQRQAFKISLVRSGLELMDDKRAMLIERIRNVVIELVHHTDELPKMKFSDYLSKKLDYNYTYLANLFSETEGMTIEHFMLLHKIERVKELILYDELNLTEISYQLNYSSVAALSNQFKKITGLTPSFFKQLKDKKRTVLEDVGIMQKSGGVL